jgi:ankyrin repeat protein
MYAAWKTSLESVQLLLAAGASWSRRNDVGCTALMYSVCSRSDNAAAVLDVVEALLAAGSLVELRDLAGNTALHVLALVSHGKPWAADAARLLLGSGADWRIKNYSGKTPLQCLPVTARGGELHRLL